MTKTAQDFRLYAGFDSALEFTVQDENGAAINISSVQEITWFLKRDMAAAPALTLTKTGGAITFKTDGTDGVFVVAITAAQTANLTGYYLHLATIKDGFGAVTPVTLGRGQFALMPTATYSGDPSLSTRDAVRNYIGDTDMASPQMMDPEIDFIIAQFPGALFAAAQCARTLAGRYARKVSKRVGDLSINYSDVAKSFRDLASDLQIQAEQTGVSIYVGGVSKSDMAAVDANSDRVPQPFSRGQFDIPGGNAYPSSTDPECP